MILQPGEETGRGAGMMIDEGALENVSCIFGAHVDRRFDIGMVVAQKGPLAASADTFSVTYRAHGAHGARPHESADPIVGAAHLVTALQTLVSRSIDPATPGVVTVGSIHAGRATNIIPTEATLEGTVRATLPTVREQLLDGIKRIAESTAITFGLESQVQLHMGPGPVVNNDIPSTWAAEAVTNALGGGACVPLGFTNMAGEDFASYLEHVPGCFMRIGARESGGQTVAAHSPQFYAHADSVFVGAAVLAETARLASERLKSGS